MTQIDVLTIVGSVREDSWNHRLARAADSLAPDAMSFEIVRSDLPIYDADIDAGEAPDAVGVLRSAAGAAAGILVVTPEYNHGIPGPLKNTLDWLSRPAYQSPLRDKPVTSMGVTPGPGNTGRAIAQVNQFFNGVAAAPLPWQALALGNAATLFDGDTLIDETTVKRLSSQLEAFMAWIAAVDGYRMARNSQ